MKNSKLTDLTNKFYNDPEVIKAFENRTKSQQKAFDELQ